MKNRILPLLLALVLFFGVVPLPARAAGDVVYVTIADMGEMQIVRYPVTLEDKNGTGAYEIDDVLMLAHNEETDQLGGYSSGSDVDKTEGIWITRLWSRWHAGYHGFTVNGVKAYSAADPVKAGDEIYAWNYYTTDWDELKDIEACFDEATDPVVIDIKPGESVTLTLGPEKALTNGAQIRIYPMQSNGWKLNKTYSPETVTMDAEGNFSYTFEKAGVYCILAEHTSEAKLGLVPAYRYVFVRDFVCGDVNGDGAVNMQDATMLSRYLADWDVEPNLDAADTDVSGAVNMQDVTLLRRYLAGWDVTLGQA